MGFILSILAFVALVVHLLLLLSGISGVPLDFENTRSFYHDFQTGAQRLILHNTQLDVKETVDLQEQLLANQSFEISAIYNDNCNLIRLERALKILQMGSRRELSEERWLSMACLSPAIIEARRRRGNWPPTRIPLLIDGLPFHTLTSDHVYELLRMVMEQPHLWHSMDWVANVDWDTISLDLWRVANVASTWGLVLHNKMKIVLYMQQALLRMPRHSTRANLEEFFIKAIRVIYWVWRHKREDLLLAISQALQEFKEENGEEEEEEDLWKKELITVIEARKSKYDQIESFVEALLQSALFRMDFWLEHVVDSAKAVSNILELLIVLVDLSRREEDRGRINELLLAFIAAADISEVAPVMVSSFLFKIIQRGYGAVILPKCLAKWAIDINILKSLNMTYALPPLKDPRLWQVIRHRVKHAFGSLKDRFVQFKMLQEKPESAYLRMIYAHWIRNPAEWPGLLQAHNLARENLGDIFGHFDELNGDPKVAQFYPSEEWGLIFQTILFEFQYAIHRRFVPSRCFLEALLYYDRKRHFYWDELQSKFSSGDGGGGDGADCSFPIDPIHRHNYMTVLTVARWELQWLLSLIPWLDGSMLHAALRGDGGF